MCLNGPLEWKAACQRANETELYVLDTLAKILYLESFSLRTDQSAVGPMAAAPRLSVCDIGVFVMCWMVQT